MPKNSLELIELLITQSVNDWQINNPDAFIQVANRARPQGFAEHFALLLDETPTIHSTLNPDFFLHFFLGSILTLPNSALMSKLKIEGILFSVSTPQLKLVFKIRNQDHYKFKFIIIDTSPESQNIGFTDGELAEIKQHYSNSLDHPVVLEGQIFHIVNDKGFKLKILPESSHQAFLTLSPLEGNTKPTFVQVQKYIQEFINVGGKKITLENFDQLLNGLSSKTYSEVKTSTQNIFTLLKKIYNSYGTQIPVTSEASHHGYIYGFFRLNYKYKYALDCYVERISGNGYADLVLLSRKDNKEPFLVIVELKAGQGAAIAMEQITNIGYVENLPNIRSNAKKVVKVGLDITTDELIVESSDIRKALINLIPTLVNDVKFKLDVQTISEHIKANIESLYYASIKNKDLTYLSRVLLGQSLSFQDETIEKYIFKYASLITDAKVTTLIFQEQNRGIILSIVERCNNQDVRVHEHDGYATRSRGPNPIFDNEKIPSIDQLGIKDLTTVNINVKPKARNFLEYITSESIQVTQKNINQFSHAQKYQGNFQKITTLKVNEIIDSIYNSGLALGYETDIEGGQSSAKKRKLAGNVQVGKSNVDTAKLLREGLSEIREFISSERELHLILQGLFTGQKYNQYTIKVFSEISYGHGRVDLALFFVNDEFEERKPVIIELKYIPNSQDYKSSYVKSKIQLTEYINYLKSSTDHKEVAGVSVIYSSKYGNDFIHVKTFSTKVDHTSHSSSAGTSKLKNIGNYKQEAKISVIDPILSEDVGYQILDFNDYHLDNDDYRKLVDFLRTPKIGSAHLATINLSNNNIDDSKAKLLSDMLANNVFINELDLSHNQLENTGVKELISALISKENIQALETKSPSECYVIKEILRHNNNRYSLTKLDLSSNNFDFSGAQLLGTGLGKLDGLQHLTLSKNNIGDAGLSDIAEGLKDNYSLQALELSNIQCSIKGIQKLAETIRDKESLIALDLSENHIGLDGIRVLSEAVEHKKAIQKLNLAGNNCVPNLRFDILAKLAKISNLKVLNFANNLIGDNGLTILVDALKTHVSITYLDLSGNSISNADGLFSLLKHYKILTHLILSNNQISNLQLLSESLVSSTKLTYLDLKKNPLDIRDVDHLFRTLSHCTVPLEHLALSGINLSRREQDQLIIKDSLRFLISTSEHLEYLGLSECNIDDTLAKVIFDELEFNSKLKILDLSHNKITISDASIILGKSASLLEDEVKINTGFITYNDKLQALNLAHNNIQDTGGKALIRALKSRAEELKAREARNAVLSLDLDLSHNNLAQEFITKLSYELPTLHITSLKLAGNDFGVQAANQLINAVAGNAHIIHLDLHDSTYSADQKRLNYYLTRNKVSTIKGWNTDRPEIPTILSCLPSTSRMKRGINECKVGWSDVDAISKDKTRDIEKIVLDAEKFLEYSKQHITDEQKSLQLVRLAEAIQNKGDEKIVGEYRGLFDQVIAEGGYKNYIQQERIKDIGQHVVHRDGNGIGLKLKLKLINAAGKVQLIHGTYSTITSCLDEIGSNCALSVGGLGYSFLSQPIENTMVKMLPKMVKNTADVTGKIVPKMFSYDTKFVVHTFGAKYGTKFAKSGAGALAGIFDIVDIGISANTLNKCSERAENNDPCSDKEIRDSIAAMTFGSISFFSGVATAAMGTGPAGIIIGFSIMVGQGIYNGVSTIIEYKKNYDTTHGENWSIFWRTLVLKRMSEDVQYLRARHEFVNSITKSAYDMLNQHSDEVVAYAVGLGNIALEYRPLCTTTTHKLPVFCIGRRPASGPCSDGGPGYIEENVTECTIRSDHIPVLHPAASTIDLRHASEHNAHNLSRVLPKPISNTTMICLPKITNKIYEKGITSSRSEAIYKCDNAVVMVHNARNYSSKDKYIVYDLTYVNAGTIIGDPKLNNIFQIFTGDAQIFGSSNLNNIFNILDDKYHGKVYLGNNSTNIINVRNLTSDYISMEYTHIYPLTMSISINTGNGISQIYSASKDVEIRYIGPQHKVDKIVCKQLLYQAGGQIVQDNDHYHNNIIIDSGGGTNYRELDEIKNCTKLIVAPNTQVYGGNDNYTIYIKSQDYTAEYALSRLDIAGKATIIFPEISLLNDCTKIEYKSLYTNSLVIGVPLAQDGQYELILNNYLNHGNTTNYVLIDKYGNNVVPKLGKMTGHNNIIQDFEVYAHVRALEFTDIRDYYKNTTKTHHDYAVFGTLRNKNGQLFRFGSVGNDVISDDGNTRFMQGGEGSDLYIAGNPKSSILYINNKSTDLALDVLYVPEVAVQNIILKKHGSNFVLIISDTTVNMEIIILNYFTNTAHQHIAIMDKSNNSFIPFDKEGVGVTFLPFYHASLERNIFILSPSDKDAVINIDADNMVFGKQGYDLLLIERKESKLHSPSIIFRDYYKDKGQWLNVKLYAYNKGVSSIINLSNIEISTINYQAQYDSVIKEYIVDLSEISSNIIHNQHRVNGKLVSVGDNPEKVGVVIFKNTPIKRLKCIDHVDTKNLVLRDGDSGNRLTIKNWYEDDKYKPSIFEFDAGVMPERIEVSDTTIERIKLNNILDREIGKIDSKVVKAMIDYLKLSCTRDNEKNILAEKLRYSFLEEELSYRTGNSSNPSYTVEEIRKYLNSDNNIVGTTFIWLVFKAYNELLLKYPDIEKKDLNKIDDNCFQIVLSYPKIEEIIRDLQELMPSKMVQFASANKANVQSAITRSINTLEINSENSHHRDTEHNRNKRHSGDTHISDHRGRQLDIEDERKVANDNHDDALTSEDNIDAMFSSSASNSLKPVGYDIANWIRDSISKLSPYINLTQWVKKMWFNDDTTTTWISDFDVPGDLSCQSNDVDEFSKVIESGWLSSAICQTGPQPNRYIDHEAYKARQDQVLSYTPYDAHCTLALLNVVARKITGVKDTPKLVFNENIYIDENIRKDALSMAYSAFAPLIEEEVGLLAPA